jgi:rare lipoprotein A
MTSKRQAILSDRLPIFRAVRTFAVLLLMLAAVSLFAQNELQGLASWYGGKFHGRLTSSGEVFDTNELTAAHRTLPFGTRVKVTNLDNGRSVVVKINDRGPFVEPRILDLSRAAAEELAMVDTGVALVSLEIIDFASDRELYAVQVGAYGRAQNAEKARGRLEAAGFVVTFEKTALGITRVSARAIPAKDLPEFRKKLEALGFSMYLVKKEKIEAPRISDNVLAAPASREITLP